MRGRANPEYLAMTKTIFLFVWIIILIALPFGWGLVPHLSSVEKSFSAAQEVRTPDSEADRKIVVCYGYADLEGGITSLHPSQLGRVAEVLVKENDSVEADAVLLRLDDSAARFRVAEAKALVDKALAELTEAKKAPEQHRSRIAQQQAAIKVARARTAGAQRLLAARKAEQRTERPGRLIDNPVLVEEIASSIEHVKELQETEKVEQENLNILEAREPTADVERARAEVATMRARLLQAEQVLEEHVLRAPQEGRVERVFVTPGEWLSPQSKKTAIQFCPDKPRIIRAEVEQVFALRVEVGQPALVEDDGRSGKTWRGHVMRIADWYTQRRLVAEEQLQFKDVRTLECLIALDPGQAPLRIGQRVRVTISEEGKSCQGGD
jgi:multidrug resistance efflux pump